MTDDKIRISWNDIRSSQTDDPARMKAFQFEPQVARPTYSASTGAPHTAERQPMFVFNGAYFGGPTFAVIAIGCLLVSVLYFAVLRPALSSARHIEAVLRQDSEANIGTTSAVEVAHRMRSIDLSRCPNDFRSAYLSHVHAWESFSKVVQEQENLNSWSQIAADSVESFIRGFLGDPFGKLQESNAAHSVLQQKLQSAGQQIRDSFHRVEEVALSHGAVLPSKKQVR